MNLLTQWENKRSETPFVGPEPACGIPGKAAKGLEKDVTGMRNSNFKIILTQNCGTIVANRHQSQSVAHY
jgi:hypothetical protein